MSEFDRECIELCLKGHPNAFRELVDRYEMPLLAHLTGLLGNRGRAEEAAQETFVRAYFALIKLKKRNSFLPWLLGIAQRVAKEWTKKQAREKKSHRALAGMGVEEIPHENRASDYELEKAVTALADPYREVILLRYYEGLSCAQVAEHLEISVGAVTKRLSRAHRMLRELLRQEEKT